MKKMKLFSALAIALTLMCGVATLSTNAQEPEVEEVKVTYVDPSGIAEFTGDPFYNPTTGKQARGIFSSYKLTADKKSTQRKCACSYKAGYDFQCNGWVKIVDKKSGTSLKHSTTAALSTNLSDSMYYGAVKETGVGKVAATSKWMHGRSAPRVFWDWVK